MWFVMVLPLKIPGPFMLFLEDTRFGSAATNFFTLHDPGDAWLKGSEDANMQDVLEASQDDLRGASDDHAMASAAAALTIPSMVLRYSSAKRHASKGVL